MARSATVQPHRRGTLTSLPATVVALLLRLRSDLPVVGTVAGVTLVTAFIFAAIPLSFNRMSDNGLRQAVSSAPSYLKNIQATHADQLRATDDVDTALDVEAAKFEHNLAPSIQGAIDHREVVVDSPRFTVRDLPDQPAFPFPRFITLRYQSNLAPHTTLISGRLPAPTTDTMPVNASNGQTQAPVIEIALSPETARQLGVQLGQTLLLLPDSDDPLARATAQSQLGFVAVHIVGLVDVIDVKNDYWFGDVRIDQASVFDDGNQVRIYAYASFARDAYPTVLPSVSPLALSYSWRYFVDQAHFSAGNVGNLARDMRKLDAQYPGTSFGRPTDYAVRTGLSAIFKTFQRQRALTESILSLASIGLLAVAVTVLGLVAGLSAERRRDTVALVRSRGASSFQVLSAQAAESLALTVPVAVVGYLLAVALIAKRGSGLSPLLALGIALSVTLLSVAAAMPLARRGLQQLERGDTGAKASRLSPRRVAFEAFVVVLAVAGVYLLRRRGLSANSSAIEVGGFDAYLAAVPVLVGLATGLVVLRLFPLPVRLLAWLASLRRDLLPSLGLRRVSRQPAVTALPLLVLLLAVAVAVFSSVMLHSIQAGQVRSAWETVGADYRVDPVAGGSLYSALNPATVPGVEAVAPAYDVPDQVLASKVPTFGQVNFFAIDAPNYQRVAGGTPVDPHFPTALLREPEGQGLGTPSNPIPAIVSRRWVQDGTPHPGDTFAIKIQGREVSFVVSQVRDNFTTLPKDEPFIVTTLPSLQAVFADRPLRATNLFLRAPANAFADIEAALTQQSSATSLVSRDREYAKVHDAPLISGTALGFQIGVLLAAGYSTLAIVIALALTARARARDLAFLRTLGLSEAQSIGLVAVELGPPIAVALVVGVAMGVGIARLIKPGLDLTAFTGQGVAVPLRIDWATVIVLAIGLIVIVSAAVWAVGAAARRANLGAALRLGDE